MRNISSSSRAFSDLVSPSIVVNLMQRLRTFALLAVMSLVVSCDSPTEIRTGSIRIALLSEGGTPALVDSRKGDLNETPDMRAEGTLPNVLLDAVQVRVVGGGTDRTVTSTTPSGGNFLITVDNLPASSYTVSVTGLVNSQVAHFGETSGVQVTAGQTSQAAVTFPVFQPSIPNVTVVDTTDVLSFDIAYTAVTGATGYRIEWSQSSSFTAPQTKDTTGLGARIAVTAEGNYYVRVRALNPNLTAPGLATPTKGVFVHQGVAAVTVTPATPTIAAGATQLLTAEARDAVNAVVPSITWFWSSSNQSVALVSQTGLVTGVNGGAVTITAMARGTPGSAAVAVTARPATKLAFSAQPGNAAAGTTIPTVRVAIQDATGATVTTDNTTQVTIAIGSDAGPGGVLGGLTTVSAVAGVATFANLSIPQAGAGYSLVSSTSGLTSATSANFIVTPGAATQLLFTVAPSTTAALAAMSPAVQVTVQDALGNRVGAATAAVTVAIGTNPSAGVLAGTRVVNAVSGVASFSGLSINQGGTGYTLTASASGLTGATSGVFDIGAILPASQLAFSIQPADGIAGDPLSPAVQIEVRNASGERVTTSRDAVTLAFAANPGAGSLSGTKTVNAINGIASFTGLAINKAAGGYTLAASSGSLTASTSTAFTITPAAAAKLRFTSQPANAKGNVAQAGGISAAIADAFDNTVTTATSNVTLSLGASPWRSIVSGGGGTVTATSLTVAAVGGIASFANVRIDKPGVNYSLAASSSGVSAGSSTEFNINVTFNGAISAGSSGGHTCAVSTESGTYCWGENYTGQLGSLTGATNSDSIPARVATTLVFSTITAGAAHTCGLVGGTAYCWGYNGSGQLGNNTTIDAATPVQIAGSLVFSSIDAGGYHTCGITTAAATAAIDRQVYCWGNGGNGQLGNSASVQSNIPVRVSDPLQTTTRAVSISAGGNHTCAVALNSLAYCWGYGGYGQLGTAAGVFASTNLPTQVHALGTYTWTSISAGSYHTCGISSNGGNIARCWGYNGSGALGDNTTTQSAIPVAVAGSLTTWSRVTVGEFFSCGSTASFTQCWGDNNSGQLGSNEATNQSLTPVLVVGGLTFTALDAGAYHACGRTGAGLSSVIYCWGNNSGGRLGSTGVNQSKRSPTLVVQ